LSAPRPHLWIKQLYRNGDTGYIATHQFKPGMTGLASEGLARETAYLEGDGSAYRGYLRYQRDWSSGSNLQNHDPKPS